MRVQFVASLALLQLHSFTAAAAAGTSSQGSNTMVGTSGNHGAATSPSGHNNHGSKPHGDHDAATESRKGGANSGHGSDQKVKGLPRMVDFPGVDISPASGGVVSPSTVDFPGIHISPASGGVVHPASATWDKRTVASGVSLPDSDLLPEYDCNDSPYVTSIAGLRRRCTDFKTTYHVPDPIPADCPSCVIARSSTGAGSATTEARTIPSGLSGDFNYDCPIIDRRGDFVIKRCPKETIGIPIWTEQEMKNTEPLITAMDKKRAPTANEPWTRSDGGESYFECGSMDAGGNFVAKRCPEETADGGVPFDLDTVTKRFIPTATFVGRRASSTTERSLFSSGLPYLDECGIMGRGELLVRVVCCDTNCDSPNLEGIDLDDF